MTDPSLILASGSPRRRMLLHMAGFDITAVHPPDVPEIRSAKEAPVAYARRLSVDKATAITAHHAWILAADTIVHRGDTIFEKPTDDADAQRMLSELSGLWHRVTSAWCLHWSGPGRSRSGRRVLRGHCTSRVRFLPLTSVQIDRYVETGEGRDKAGGYAVQGEGSALIDRVVGSTTNVVGLPLTAVISALEKVGVPRGTR